ncbi:MAG: tRNA preQ1(34) S-adenosylmethionine ribosyltransferase-isomerase QueA [Pseudomonadota bacterium]
MFSIHQYEYDLPDELIAQEPVRNRDQSRLLRFNRREKTVSHHRFRSLEDLLTPTDLLVINNTEVIPARMVGKKETGGRAEVLLLDFPKGLNKENKEGDVTCECLVKTSKRPKSGSVILFDGGLKGEILEGQEGIYYIRFSCEGGFMNGLYRAGSIPLPPYVRRESGMPTPEDAISYQTVYASQKGAVAAPTAGLHFSKELLKNLKSKGVRLTEITLHVGYGTFLPVRVMDIREHRIHPEWYSISEDAAKQINDGKQNLCRIVAVGTTCVRALEFASNNKGVVKPGTGLCNLFIFPGFRFKTIDAMITNFHLPKSTLLMLVSAFAGREEILSVYEEAIRNRYRFYSYGDAMLIE